MLIDSPFRCSDPAFLDLWFPDSECVQHLNGLGYFHKLETFSPLLKTWLSSLALSIYLKTSNYATVTILPPFKRSVLFNKTERLNLNETLNHYTFENFKMYL